MAWFYADTSALVKRYAAERGTIWVRGLADPTAGHDLWTVRLTGPETISAFVRKVRTGELTVPDSVQAAQDFRTDWTDQYRIVEVSPAFADRAMDLVLVHGLRGYDAVHLAAALYVARFHRVTGAPLPFVLIPADARQLAAAQQEGLTTDNPNNHP